MPLTPPGNVRIGTKACCTCVLSEFPSRSCGSSGGMRPAAFFRHTVARLGTGGRRAACETRWTRHCGGDRSPTGGAMDPSPPDRVTVVAGLPMGRWTCLPTCCAPAWGLVAGRLGWPAAKRPVTASGIVAMIRIGISLAAHSHVSR